jgi:hypothetical protein
MGVLLLFLAFLGLIAALVWVVYVTPDVSPDPRLARRLAIEEALRAERPDVIVLPAWQVLHFDDDEYSVLTISEDMGDTPAQVADRALREIANGPASQRFPMVRRPRRPEENRAS